MLPHDAREIATDLLGIAEAETGAGNPAVVVDTLSRSPRRTLTISAIREYASKGEQQHSHGFNFLGPCCGHSLAERRARMRSAPPSRDIRISRDGGITPSGTANERGPQPVTPFVSLHSQTLKLVAFAKVHQPQARAVAPFVGMRTRASSALPQNGAYRTAKALERYAEITVRRPETVYAMRRRRRWAWIKKR